MNIELIFQITFGSLAALFVISLGKINFLKKSLHFFDDGGIINEFDFICAASSAG